MKNASIKNKGDLEEFIADNYIKKISEISENAFLCTKNEKFTDHLNGAFIEYVRISAPIITDACIHGLAQFSICFNESYDEIKFINSFIKAIDLAFDIRLKFKSSVGRNYLGNENNTYYFAFSLDLDDYPMIEVFLALTGHF